MARLRGRRSRVPLRFGPRPACGGLGGRGASASSLKELSYSGLVFFEQVVEGALVAVKARKSFRSIQFSHAEAKAPRGHVAGDRVARGRDCVPGHAVCHIGPRRLTRSRRCPGHDGQGEDNLARGGAESLVEDRHRVFYLL